MLAVNKLLLVIFCKSSFFWTVQSFTVLQANKLKHDFLMRSIT